MIANATVARTRAPFPKFSSAGESQSSTIQELRERKQRLFEKFAYKDEFDKQTYEEQLDRLNEEIAIAELEERDTRIEEMDGQAAVRFGEYVLLNAARLWAKSPLEQEQRLQKALFPRGVKFEAGSYRTDETSIVFFNLQAEQAEEQDMVALTGIEPVFRP